MTPDEKLLTPNEVAERLALSSFTVANMLRAGTLPGMKVGTLWRIREADLDAYIVAGSEAAAAKREARAVAAKRKAAGLPPKGGTRPRAPRKAKAAEEGGTP